MTLATAFGFDQNTIRTRSFEYNGHTFKVRVPVTSETESMFERMKKADSALIEKHYKELSQPFLDNREKYSGDTEVEFKDDDIFVKGYSLQETAKNKALTEVRVTELFRLLVPQDQAFDMSKITYAEIDEIFPFSIQMEMVEEIGKVISPSYSETRKK